MTTSMQAPRGRGAALAPGVPIPSLMQLRRHLSDPTAFYRSLPHPLYWDKTIKSWVVTGFLAAKQVLGQPAVFSSARLRANDPHQGGSRAEGLNLNALLQKQMLFTDGPFHDGLRALLLPSFHRRTIAGLQAYIQATVEEFLTPYHAAPGMDLVDVAAALPTRVSAHLLGLAEDDASVRQWMRWNSAFEDVLGSLQSLLPSKEQSLPTLAEACAYFRDLVGRVRSAHPQEASPRQDSLLAAMIASAMADEDIVANSIVLLAGGYQTTSQLITRSLCRIYRTEELRGFLEQNPGRTPDALRETMRLEGSSQFLGRRATQDTVLAGEPMQGGDNVIVLLAAANRDPQQFPDPDTFDLDRPQREHLGFGLGPHHCWGADLALLEARVVVQEFLARYPDAQFPPDELITWGGDPNVRYPLSVPLLLRRNTSRVAGAGEGGGNAMAPPAAGGWDEPGLLRAVREWNATETAVPPEARAHHYFEQQARLHPDAPAIVEQGTTLFTYRQFNERANQLAHLLQQRGVGPQAPVGVYMDRSAEAALCFLAILKAGGVYAPLASDEHPERLKKMLANMQPALVLSRRALRSRLAGLGIDLPVLDFDGLEELLGRCPTTNHTRAVEANSLAYIIYTSGSTGEPKGAEVPHASVAQLVVAQAMLTVGSGDRIAQVASLTYDASIFEMLLALCHGAALCFPAFRAGRGLADFLRAERVTGVVLTPTVLMRTRPDDLPDLRLVMAAGETCTAEVVARWAGAGRVFYNLYGPTEACVWATAERCEANGIPPGIGRPVANKQVYILDAQLRLVPPGTVGMLYIAGGLFAGYRGDAVRSAQVLIPNPYQDGAQLYRSGDLASWTPEGTIVFHDRAGDYVKIHGLRISLGEIEAALAGAPGISGGAVVLRDDRLVAFVIPTDAYSEGDLIAHLKGRLPPQMVPGCIVALADFPRKPHSDKLDRHALQLLELPPHPQATSHVLPAPGGPTPPLVQQIQDLFCQVLEREDVQPDADFFDYDGDSATGLDLVLLVEQHFGIRLDDMAIYDHPTARGFAAHVQACLDGSGRGSGPGTTGGWIVCRHPRPRASVRLLVLPEAGVGASRYFSWERILQEEWTEGELELGFIQLPGREERHQETAFTHFTLLLEALVQQIRGYADRPYGLYGHSLGALIGFELARALQREQLPLPLGLWCSGCSAPHLPSPASTFYRQSDGVFLDHIRTLGGVPEELLQDGALMQRLLPLLRADFSLVATHAYVPGPPLPLPVSIWGGRQDSVFGVDAFLAWSQIQPNCSIHLVEGGHFFHHDPAARHMLVSTVCHTLQRLLQANSSSAPRAGATYLKREAGANTL